MAKFVIFTDWTGVMNYLIAGDYWVCWNRTKIHSRPNVLNSTKLRVRPEEVVRQSVASKIQSKYINIVAFAFCQKSKLFGSCDIGLPIPPPSRHHWQLSLPRLQQSVWDSLVKALLYSLYCVTWIDRYSWIFQLGLGERCKLSADNEIMMLHPC